MKSKDYSTGKQQTLVILDGNLENAKKFRRKYDLTDDYHVIIPDIYPDKMNRHLVYDPDKKVKDVLKLLKREDDGTVLIGHNLGAELALKLKAECPERFGKTVLLSPNLLASELKVPLAQKMATSLIGAQKQQDRFKDLAVYMGFDDKELDELNDYALNNGIPKASKLFKNRVRLADLPDLSDISKDILAICIEKDPDGIKDSVKQFQSKAPHCTALVLRGVSPKYAVNGSDKVSEAISGFLKEAQRDGKDQIQ